MAIVFEKFPPACAAAFDPMTVVVRTPKARYAQLERAWAATTAEAERTRIRAEMDELEADREQQTLEALTVRVMLGENGEQTVRIEREPDADGRAAIDLSYILRHSFLRRAEPSKLHPLAEQDWNLRSRYALLDAAGVKRFEGHALNAAGQVARYGAEGIAGCGLLTQTPLVRYPGYPLAPTFLQFPDRSCSLLLRTESVSKVVPMLAPSGNIPVAGGDHAFDSAELRDASGEVVAQYRIETGCVPALPFYVRWINTQAGWDYRMFERREQTSEVTGMVNIQRVATDPDDTQQTVALTAAESVTVGAGLLEREEYRVLAALARSPRIEWYDETAGAWRTIVLAEEFSAVWNAANAYGSVEFTFALPRIQTQF